MTSYATVLAPRVSAAATRIGPSAWRKLVLPAGEVVHGGQTYRFSPEYLAEIASAFADRAYDRVPLQLSGGLDPEDFGGHITALEADAAGLFAVIEATPRGNAALDRNPALPLSARITAGYERSDGEFFPAALQSVSAGSAIGLSNSGGGGPAAYYDLSQSWLGEPGPAFDLSTSAVASRLGYDDAGIDAITQASLPPNYGDGHAELAEFDRVFQLSNETELTRLAEDAVPLPVRAEDRMAYLVGRAGRRTLTPQGQFAYGLANTPDPMAATTDGVPCGFIDATGRCGERYHAAYCNALATPFIAENLKPQMERIAHRPHLDENGRTWQDPEYGSHMSLLDHLESMTGQRLGDVGLFETGRSKRQVVQAKRSQVFGDPDDPDAMPLEVSASTARTAERLARQSGIQTSAGVREQQTAWKQQHQRLQARIGKPRSADYSADLSNPVHQATGLAQFEASLLGSLPVYAAAGTVSGTGDEVFV